MFNILQSNNFEFDSNEFVCEIKESNTQESDISQPEYVLQKVGNLTVKILEARGLSKEGQTSISSFVILKIGHHKMETSTIEKTQNPVWAEQFRIELDNLHQEIQIDVMTEKKKSNELIGRVSVLMDDVKTLKSFKKWYKLIPRSWKENISGEIHLDIHYEASDPVNDESEITFKEIIQNRFSATYFQKYLIKKCCEENIDFYQQVQDFKILLRDKKMTSKSNDFIEEIYNLAKSIYDQFIKDGAKQELNLESEMKESFNKNFSNSKEKDFVLNVKLFDDIEKRIYNLMESIYPHFLKSSEFKQLTDQLNWIDKFRSFNVSSIEPLSRLVDTLNDKDVMILEELIEKKKKGILSFKRDKIYCKAIIDSEDPKSIPFVKGDILTVLEINQKDELWLCEFKEHIGHVSSSIISTKIIENREILKKYHKHEILTSFDMKKPSKSSLIIPSTPPNKKEERETHWVSFQDKDTRSQSIDSQLLAISVSMVEEEEEKEKDKKDSPSQPVKKFDETQMSLSRSLQSMKRISISPRSGSSDSLLDMQEDSKTPIKSKKSGLSPRVVPFQYKKSEDKK